MRSEDGWVGNYSESVTLSVLHFTDTQSLESQLLFKLAVPFLLSHINERVKVASPCYSSHRKAKLLKQWFP